MSELTTNPPAGTVDPQNPAPIQEPGTIDQSWLDQFKDLPDDIKKDPSLKPFKDIGGLLKSYVSAQKMIGKDRAILPTDKSSPEDWKNFYQKLGLPEKDKYDFKLPEGIKADDTLNAIKEMAYQNGILPRQMQPVLDAFYAKQKEAQQAAMDSHKKATEEELSKLKGELGNAYPKHIGFAQETIKAFAPDGFAEWLEKSGAGDNPLMIKLLSAIGAKMTEAPMKGLKDGSDGAMTPDQIAMRQGEIMSDPAYWDSANPKHGPLVAELTKLMGTQG